LGEECIIVRGYQSMLLQIQMEISVISCGISTSDILSIGIQQN
jgi:hypothetical protein